jgi:hypothetical protein
MTTNNLRTCVVLAAALCGAAIGCAASETGDLALEDDGQGGSGNNAGEPANGGTGDSGGTAGSSSGSGNQGGSGAAPAGGTDSGGTDSGGTDSGGTDSGGTGNGGTTPTGGTAGTMPTPPGRQTIPLPYTDDFETSMASDWRFISVPWTVTDDGGNNVLQLSSTGDSETTWAVGGDRNWTDVRVEMRVKFVSGEGMILLSPRWLNTDSYAFVEYEAEDKPKLRSRVNGSTSDLITAAETITFTLGQWHTVAVTLVGTSSTLEIDGTVIGMNASSTLAPSGGIGIAVENGIVAIDDVSVTAP